MKKCLQEILLYIPLYQLTFLTPVVKEHIYYESTLETHPEHLLQKPTLLLLHQKSEISELNDENKVMQLIQDSNLKGIIILYVDKITIKGEILNIFRQFQIPIIQVADYSLIHLFKDEKQPFLSYSHMSLELNGMINTDFLQVASNLSETFHTPFLYLNENDQLVWQEGKEAELEKAIHWLHSNMNKLCLNNRSNLYLPMTIGPYDIYQINIAGVIRQLLITSSDLADWQKKMIDKLVGMIALLLQTEGMLLKQEERLREHFIYDLLYHKFESKAVMVKQGKSWGWNLEKPHHLIIINIEFPINSIINDDWLLEMIQFLEYSFSDEEDKLIIFPFQEQIVVLLEDEEERTLWDRKKYVMDTANQLKKILKEKLLDCQIFIGIGKLYQDTIFINKSYQEAKLALQFGRLWFENRTIFHINDLGILRLFLHIHQEILDDYAHEYLSPVIESDRKYLTDYLNTLKVFIQYQGILTEAADALHVHPNTLRNRIKKIEELTGVDFQDITEFTNLTCAVKIYSLLESQIANSE